MHREEFSKKRSVNLNETSAVLCEAVIRATHAGISYRNWRNCGAL
jgi:hypothetical protein